MRISWLFVVGIAAGACKDKGAAPAPKPAEQPVPAAPVTPDRPAGEPAPRAVPPPTLEAGSAFAAEQQDAAWASATEKAIAAVAPELTSIECRQSHCRATLTGASDPELVARTEKIQEPEGLPSTDAKSVLLSAPEVVDGKRVMTIYVRYDR